MVRVSRPCGGGARSARAGTFGACGVLDCARNSGRLRAWIRATLFDLRRRRVWRVCYVRAAGVLGAFYRSQRKRRRSARSGAAVPHIIKRRCHCEARAPSPRTFAGLSRSRMERSAASDTAPARAPLKREERPTKRQDTHRQTRAEEKHKAGRERRDDPPQRAAGSGGGAERQPRRAHRRSEPKGARRNQEQKRRGTTGAQAAEPLRERSHG